MKKTILILFAALAASLLTGCSRSKSTVDKLTFTYVTSPLNIPSIIEREQQIFAKNFEGIPVEYAEITSGAEQTQALASGDVQVLYAVGATSVILSAANGSNIKVLNMYSRSPKAFCLYSKNAGINSPEDLRGKKIAGPAGTNLHELLTAYLASGGMTLSDVDYVSMAIPAAKAALDGGSIDVAMVAGALAYNCQLQGYHKVTDGENLICAIIAVAVTDDFYKNNPDIIKKLTQSQAEIASYIKDNQEKAFQTVADKLGLTLDAVKEMAEYYNFSTELSESDIKGFQKTADFMYETKMIEKSFDVKTLFIK